MGSTHETVGLISSGVREDIGLCDGELCPEVLFFTLRWARQADLGSLLIDGQRLGA